MSRRNEGRRCRYKLTVSLISFGESVIWRQPHDLFRVTETGRGIIYCGGDTFFFYTLFVFFPEKTTKWGLTGNIHGRTEETDPGACIGARSGRTWGVQGSSQMFFLMTCGDWTGTGLDTVRHPTTLDTVRLPVKSLMISIWSCWSKMGGGEEGKSCLTPGRTARRPTTT